MKIGIVVHGPGIIDTGYALKIIETIDEYGEIKSRLGGTMGRTAVIDAKLEGYHRYKAQTPPQSVNHSIHSGGMDVIFPLKSVNR